MESYPVGYTCGIGFLIGAWA